MKKFFESHWGATLVTLLVIVASTLMNVNMKLGSKCQEVSDAFYNGVYVKSDGYTHKSISSQLDMRSSAANGIISIASGYEELEAETQALLVARTELIVANSISEKHAANKATQAAYDDLVAAMALVDTTEHSNALSTYMSNFTGAQKVIEASGYNEYVRQFTRENLDVFPTNYLVGIAGITPPELFA